MLGALGQVIWPGVGGNILVIAVVLSTIATLETTLIQVTRSLFAMGRDNTIPAAFGRTHKKWKTPAFATLVVGGSIARVFIGSNFLGSVGDILSNAISSIGLPITFSTRSPIAVVVAYRKIIFTSVKNFIFIGLWPAIGAIFMIVIFGFSIPSLDPIVIAIGIGTLALGIVPIVIYWKKGAAYFKRRPLELPDELDAKAPENIDERPPVA